MYLRCSYSSSFPSCQQNTGGKNHRALRWDCLSSVPPVAGGMGYTGVAWTSGGSIHSHYGNPMGMVRKKPLVNNGRLYISLNWWVYRISARVSSDRNTILSWGWLVKIPLFTGVLAPSQVQDFWTINSRIHGFGIFTHMNGWFVW